LCQSDPAILFVQLSAEGQKEIAGKEQLVFEVRDRLEHFRHSIYKGFGLLSNISFASDFDK